MVENTSGVGPFSNQKFSTNGVKLSELKQNKLLFDYFKQAGFKEDAYIYASDIEKLKEKYDKNNNGKLSVKEARAMGFEGSRKEIKKIVKDLENIANQELTGDDLFPTVVDENTTNYYTSDGTLLRQKTVKDNSTIEKLFFNGDTSQVAGTIETAENFKRVVINKDGNPDKPQQIAENNNGEIYEADFHYTDNGALNYKKEKKDGKTSTTIYEQNGFVDRPVKVVEEYGNNLVKSTNYEYNGDKLFKEVIEGDPKLLKDREIIQQSITYADDGKTVKEVLNEFVNKTKEKTTYEGNIVRTEFIPVETKPSQETKTEEIRNVEKTKKSVQPAKTKKTIGTKISVPENWGRVPRNFRIEAQVNSAIDAKGALNAVINTIGINEDTIDKEKLMKDFIKYNPSMFDKDGQVKSDARWDRLDLPQNIAEQYRKEVSSKKELEKDNVPEYLKRPEPERFKPRKFEKVEHNWQKE